MSDTSVDAVVRRLRSLARPGGLEGMARYGIYPEKALGVRIPDLRRLAKEIGTDHGLALRLWRTGIHEGRILASMVDDPIRVTERQADAWVRAFDSWDLCDQCCGNLLDRTPFAASKARQWARSEEEFVRRAGFAVMAWKAVHDRDAQDRMFLDFLPVIERTSDDPRNFVKKSVNWALRQIGKRNRRLHRAAIASAGRIARRGTAPSRWVASDALRELRSPKVRERLR